MNTGGSKKGLSSWRICFLLYRPIYWKIRENSQECTTLQSPRDVITIWMLPPSSCPCVVSRLYCSCVPDRWRPILSSMKSTCICIVREFSRSYVVFERVLRRFKIQTRQLLNTVPYSLEFSYEGSVVLRLIMSNYLHICVTETKLQRLYVVFLK